LREGHKAPLKARGLKKKTRERGSEKGNNKRITENKKGAETNIRAFQ
jgi:hypothetical protein